MRLLTNNTDKVTQLRELGLDVVEQVPLLVGIGPNNHQYLETKRDRMGHVIGQEEIARGPRALRERAMSREGAPAGGRASTARDWTSS